MLRRNPSLTEQAKSHLKQRILNAEFVDGRIPSEADLASELNVGRSTIREALRPFQRDQYTLHDHLCLEWLEALPTPV
jgi:DNA-binding FadR family transcriptional regulator